MDPQVMQEAMRYLPAVTLAVLVCMGLAWWMHDDDGVG